MSYLFRYQIKSIYTTHVDQVDNEVNKWLYDKHNIEVVNVSHFKVPYDTGDYYSNKIMTTILYRICKLEEEEKDESQ